MFLKAININFHQDLRKIRIDQSAKITINQHQPLKLTFVNPVDLICSHFYDRYASYTELRRNLLYLASENFNQRRRISVHIRPNQHLGLRWMRPFGHDRLNFLPKPDLVTLESL